MSLIQALLLALAYAFARSSFNFGLGNYVLSQPLVAGLLAGILLGDPARGAALGGALNLITLGISQLRIRMGPDVALVGYVGVPLLLLSGLNADAPGAALIFTALIALGTLLNFASGFVNTILAHWSDLFAETGEIGVVSGITILPSQVWLFISSFLPVLLLLRVDTALLFQIADAIPAWLQIALVACQQLLAALGIALSLSLIMRGSSVAYLLLGWLASLTIGPLPATILGGSVAAIHAYLARRRQPVRDRAATPDPARTLSGALGGAVEALIPDVMPSDDSEDDLESPQSLSILQLSSSFILWAFFHNAAYNFERFQNLGFALALAPIGRRLWGTVEARAEFLRRHLTLFNTEWVLGSYIVGASAALEERKANGDAMNNSEFAGAKTSVMASLDVLGNVLMGGLVLALAVAIGAEIARTNGALGGVLFLVMASTAVIGIALFCYQLGYRQVRYWATWARVNDWLRAGLFGALRLGTFVLGALIVPYAGVHLPRGAAIHIGDASIGLGALVDGIGPHILPLVAVIWLWWWLRHRRANPLTLLFICVAVAFIACWLFSRFGWL